MIVSFLALLLTLSLVSGCTTPTKPADLFALRLDMLKTRTIQTRVFKTLHEHELLSASVAALQDLGFQIEESEQEVGFLYATQEHSTLEGTPHQHDIAASLITRPLHSGTTRQEVRIAFYRILWKSDAVSARQSIAADARSMEMIRDPKIYQQFFAKLSKALFLGAHRI